MRMTLQRRKRRLIGERWASCLSAISLRRAAVTGAIVVVTVLLIALIAFSPLALNELGFFSGRDWSRLSNIGQTYGGASALLTGFALIGVAASLVFQARAIQASSEQSSREHHVHLVEMAMNDPIYQQCWGYDSEAHVSHDDFRQRAYLNLIVSYWERDYLMGAVGEDALRHGLGHLFRGDAARRWWADVGSHRAEIVRVHRARRFVRIVNDEYEAAVISGPPEVRAEAPPMLSSHGSQRIELRSEAVKAGSAVLLGVLGGAIFSRALRRRWR